MSSAVVKWVVNNMSNLLDLLVCAVAEGKTAAVVELISAAQIKGYTAKQIIDQGLLAGLEKVSQQFDGNIVYIPEVLLASRAVNAGMRILMSEPETLKKAKSKGTVVIGTVAGDLHDIGKSLATVFFTREGFEVVDLGVDVFPEEFIQAIRDHKPDVVAMSALLTTSVPVIGEIVKHIEEAKLRNKVKLIIGGYRILPEYAKSLKVDLHAIDALQGAKLTADMF